MVDQYIFSGSLPENASTYVTREADAQLYEGLKAGKFCYVLNSRQSGKSSLRVRTMQRLREEGVQCAAVDLSAGGIQNVSPEQWYADLIDTLIDSFGLDIDFGDWWETNQLNTLITRFRKFLEEILLVEVKENIVIFIDEIDSVLSLNFPTDDFFALIRACYNKRVDNPQYNRLTFCLLGVASPSNLIEDKQRTPFNIGQAISLKGFQLHEAEPLETGLRSKFSNPHTMMQEILQWTGGQPFLTQKLCQFMIEESEQQTRRSVEQVVKSRIIENWESQDEPEHLRTIQERILQGGEDTSWLLELYQQVLLAENVSNSCPPTYDNSPKQTKLRLTGLVVEQQEKLRAYNKIYANVFNLNWVDRQLANLRPYAESFKAWKDSNFQNELRLLRGKALQDALRWADNKTLSHQDNHYISASQKYEFQQVQRKTQRVIWFGAAFLVMFIVGAIVASILASNAQKERQTALKATRLEQTGINLLRSPARGTQDETLLQAMRTAMELKSLVKDKQSLADYPAYNPIFSLQKILINIGERNHQLICGTYDIGIALSPDGKFLASASKNASIQVRDVTTCKKFSTLIGHKHRVINIVFSPDGKFLASASDDNSIKLWNLATGKEIYTLTEHKGRIISIAFSLDGKTLASTDISASIKLWNLATGKEIYTLTGNKNVFNGITFSLDGKTLIIYSSELDYGILKFCDIATGKEISTLNVHHTIAGFSQDRKILASIKNINNPLGDFNGIDLWNLTTSKQISTLNGHQYIGGVSSIAFSPDSKILASGGSDGTIILWNIAIGQEITTLTEYGGAVTDLAWSPDGKTLVFASGGKIIKLSLDLNYLLALGCKHLKEYFTTQNELWVEFCLAK
nr:AAA-like domain-containing protein [Dendronalium sp. ChiSLP03b]MDZ8203443.1 AAA-like domain-containing protein [Dendronalium sp. ChiSLP03b]